MAPFGLGKDVQQRVSVSFQVLYITHLARAATYTEDSVN